MFGYVKTERNELRIREYEYYRASYCGLCRSMGKCTGQCSRLLLSYDFAFLANVRMALCQTTPTFKRRRCIAHPIKKRPMMERNEQLDFCAAASSVLAYEKCRDNVADERGFARLKARLQCMLLHGAYRRAKKHVPELAARVRAHLERLAAAEKQAKPSVDAVAAIFGDLLADVTAHGLEGEAQLLARKIGWETGRFIYILDAVDDLEEDAKKNRFNPFLLLYGGPLDDASKQSVKDALIAGLFDLEAAFQLMPRAEDPTRQEILNNILYLGMPKTLEHVLCADKCNKEEKDEQQSL